MKIISHNVLHSNKNYKILFEKIFAENPDLICLQEVNPQMLEYLLREGERKKERRLYFHQVLDFEGQTKSQNVYLVIISCSPFLETEAIIYSERKNNCLLNNLIYEKLGKHQEKHIAHFTDIEIKNQKYRVFNMRLSCAVSIQTRLTFFREITKFQNSSYLNIFCGDFNISDSSIITLSRYLFSEKESQELKTNEREEIQKIITENNLQNIFLNQNTSSFPFIKSQLDHILVPQNLKIKKSQILEKSYGSDHKILEVEI